MDVKLISSSESVWYGTQTKYWMLFFFVISTSNLKHSLFRFMTLIVLQF